MKGTLFIILLLINPVISATDYFVSISGNDSGSGNSPLTPWKSISKINAIFTTLKPGDRVFFRSGEVFYGTLRISASGTSEKPIIFGAYGTGASPVITGFTTICGWNNHENGIYSKKISCESEPNMVTVNGVNTPIGRWPNKEFLTIDSLDSKNSFIDIGLPPIPEWTGAEVVIRKNDFIWDRNPITEHSGKKIEYSNGSIYNAMEGYGYFIQNNIKTLDQFGEWYFDGSNFYMFFGNADPGNSVVKVSSLDQLAYLSDKTGITFENISFEGANIYGLHIRNSSHISIRNCSFNFTGGTAIFGPWSGNSSYCNIENTTINNSNSNGIVLKGDHNNATIRGNKVMNSGLIVGMGENGDDTYNAITIRGSNSLIQHNLVENAGYMGIHFSGDSTVVTENYVTNFNLAKNDGGGIYTYVGNGINRSGQKVVRNIVINGPGYGEGVPERTVNASGIYIDDRAANITITDNTVMNCSTAGIYLHNAHELEITGNTVFNNGSGNKSYGSQILMVHDNHSQSDPISKIILCNNIFFAYRYPQKVLAFSSISDDIVSFGTSGNNNFIGSNKSDKIIRIWEKGWYWPSTDLSLAEWQAKTGQDSGTIVLPRHIELLMKSGNLLPLQCWKVVTKKDSAIHHGPENIIFECNPENTTKVISLKKPCTDLNGVIYYQLVKIPPFSSIILFPVI